MVKYCAKYSMFNADWIFKHKYQLDVPLDPNKPIAISTYDKEVQMRNDASNLIYYPAEKWYRDNISKV